MINNRAKSEFIDELENQVLSTILNDKQSLQDCLLLLDAIDFNNEQVRKIFASIININNEGKSISKNTVIDYISANANYQFDDYTHYINLLSNIPISISSFKADVELIKNASIKRQLDSYANKILQTEIDFSTYENQIFDLENEFLNITQNRRSSQLQTMNEVTDKFWEKLKIRMSHSKDVTGTSIGYDSIDKVTNGFQRGDLIIVAARPGTGKTAISLNFLYNAAKNIRKRGNKEEIVVMFSLEMGSDQLCQRLVSIDCAVESEKLRNGTLDNASKDQVEDSVSNLKTLPIYIDDNSDISIIDIQTKLKQLKNDYDIRLVVIDYLQLLKGPRTKGAQANRQQEVSTISRMLKLMARDIDTPIIAVAQLSRKIEERKGEGRSPMLSDLRESGAIEQDADIVTFLSHAEDEDEQEDMTTMDVVPIEYYIAKHRNGSTEKVILKFYKKYGRFEE